MTTKLKDKIALVTGGSTGIGLGIAKRFAIEGAKVFITGRREDALLAAQQAIGPAATTVTADSSDLSALDQLYRRIASEAGRIDVLVVNAGVGGFEPLGSISEESFNDTFGLNVKGAVFTVQKALPLLADGASIILVGSNTSIRGMANMSIYAASKAALRSLARSWTLELRERHIRVNVLSPGPIKTPGLLGLVGDAPAAQEALLERINAMVPLGRVGSTDEMGKVAVFLASNDASYIAGIELFADGGQAQV